MNAAKSSPAIMVCDTPAGAADRVAEIIAAAIRGNPQIVLGLATGGTPIPVYRELVRRHRDDSLDFSRLTTFNLDEYVGLGPGHPQSYRQFMQQHLFDHVNVDPLRTHVPDGLASSPTAHSGQYESQIRTAGGIDLQLLGIGHNGHIAFNEPGSSPDSRTRQVDLSEETIQANSRFFSAIDQVPRHAITMGIGTILEAKRIVLMAIGEHKSAVVERAIQGPIDRWLPASELRRNPDVTFVLDAAAASRLSV